MKQQRIGSSAVRKTAILQIEHLSVNRLDQQMASVGNEDGDNRLEPGVIQYQQTHERAMSRQLPSNGIGASSSEAAPASSYAPRGAGGRLRSD